MSEQSFSQTLAHLIDAEMIKKKNFLYTMLIVAFGISFFYSVLFIYLFNTRINLLIELIFDIIYLSLILIYIYLVKINKFNEIVIPALLTINLFLIYHVIQAGFLGVPGSIFFILITLFFSLYFLNVIVSMTIFIVDIGIFVLFIPYMSNIVPERVFFIFIPAMIIFAIILTIFIEINTTFLKNEIKVSNNIRSYLLSIFENTPNGIAVFDLQGMVVDCNSNYTSILGYSFDEIVNNHFMKFTHTDDRTWNKEIFKKIVNMEISSIKIEKRYIRKNGDTVIVEITGAPIIDKNTEIKYIMAIVNDITAVRKQELYLKQLEDVKWHNHKLETIGKITSQITHDINNSLAIINGYSDILIDNIDNTIDYKDYLIEIKKATERATSTSRRLLSYGKRTKKSVETFCVNTFIEELHSFSKVVIFNDKISFEVKKDKNCGYISVEKDQISQVIINLIINAKDSIVDTGKVVLETKISDDSVEIIVSDTGTGISEDIRANIFEPFISSKPEGSGLGLYTSYNVVKNNGGELIFDSKEGLGSTFRIVIPKVSEEIEKTSYEENHVHLLDNKKILIVDDEVQISLILAKILTKMNIKVEIKNNPLEALEYYKSMSKDIDLVITDIKIPNLDGIELTRRILEINHEQRILFITGFGEEILSQDMMNIPLISKPFDIHTIKDMMYLICDGCN